MTTTFRTMDSPVGTITLAGRDGVLTHLRMDDQSHDPADRGTWEPDVDAYGDVVEQLDAYFAGELTDFDVDLRLEGTAFQREVWAALQEIPYGETWSYGQLADHIGKPGAARAVGLANGRNRIAIVIPCHRVIQKGGGLRGYGGGLPRKQLLLQLERERDRPRLSL